jgi:hypothetical protein
LHVYHNTINNGIMLEHQSQANGYQYLLNARETEGLIFQKWTNGSFTSNVMTLDYSDRVGIGTAFPRMKLNINGGKAGIVSTENSYGQFRIGNTADNEASIGFFTGLTESTFGYGSPTATHKWAIGLDVYGIGTNKFGVGNITDATSVFTIQEGGNVGIGTTSPQQKLHIVGDQRIENATDPKLEFHDGAAVGAYVKFDTSEDNLVLSHVDVAGDNQIALANDGNVGIGTASPNAVLHAYGSTPSGTVFNVEGTNGSLFSVVDNLSGVLMSVNNNAGLPVFEVNDDDSIIAGRFAQDDFVITTDGDVGIGTDSPEYKFHVVVNSSQRGDDGIFIKDTGNWGTIKVQGAGGTDTSLHLSNWGNDTSGSQIWASGSGPLRFAVGDSGTEYARLHSNGNFGIGTANPASKLEVNGTVTATCASLGQLNVDNLRLDGNSLSSTSGYLILQPNGSNALTITGGTKGSYTVDLSRGLSNANQGAKGFYSTVGGGKNNTASSYYGTVSGGANNTASSYYYSTVGGGYCNTASGYCSIVSGGCCNRATGSGSKVGGGIINLAQGNYSTVGGGIRNCACGNCSSIIGGSCNTDSGYSNVHILGSNITATAADTTYTENLHVTCALKINKFDHTNLSVASSFADTDVLVAVIDPTGTASTEALQGSVLRSSLLNQPAQLQFRQGTDAERQAITPANGEPIWTTDNKEIWVGDGTTCGGLRMGPSMHKAGTCTGAINTVNGGNTSTGAYSTVGGGQNNTASGDYSIVSGGCRNCASGNCSTVSGGVGNCASAIFSTVGGGGGSIFGGFILLPNTASGDYSTVSGGSCNTASGSSSTVSGGRSNTASGTYSIVGGGHNNIANTFNAVIVGGREHTASGRYSTILGGYKAKTTKWGEVAHAIGSFSQLGDSQHSIFMVTRNTSNTTSTEMFIDGNMTAFPEQRMTIPAKTTWTFSIKLSAYNDTDNTAAWWIIRGGIRRNAANVTTLIGSLIEERDYEGTMSGTSAAVTADDTNESLKIAVTGLASKNIRWVAVVDVAQVSWGTP